jgi:hypothetical protein
MALVAGDRFYLMPWYSDFPNAAPGTLCWYDLRAGHWQFSKTGLAAAWAYNSGIAHDPISGKLVVSGGPPSASHTNTLWTYDPDNDAVSQVKVFNSPSANLIDLHYYPPRDIFIAFQVGAQFTAWEITFDRSKPANSTLTPITMKGDVPRSLPNGQSAWAFDGKRFGGSVSNGVMNLYDPETHVWTRQKMKMENGIDATISQVYYCIDFDPTSGCYVILASDSETYAYRA